MANNYLLESQCENLTIKALNEKQKRRGGGGGGGESLGCEYMLFCY